MNELARARHQAAFLVANCPNPDCPIGCPDEHADLGYPEINCGTFRVPVQETEPVAACPDCRGTGYEFKAAWLREPAWCERCGGIGDLEAGEIEEEGVS